MFTRIYVNYLIHQLYRLPKFNNELNLILLTQKTPEKYLPYSKNLKSIFKHIISDLEKNYSL